MTPRRKALIFTLAAILACPLVFVIEALIAIPGLDDHFRNPDPKPRFFGAQGAPLMYVVIGDSTAAGRGAQYEQGIAIQTARHLALSRRVTMVNLAVSGARVTDVELLQLPAALKLRPDVVLLAVGANDATHFTTSRAFEAGLTRTLESFATVRPDVRIVLTGSPDVGAVRRFAQPLRWLAGRETIRINYSVHSVIRAAIGRHIHVVLAPIADETGPLFRRDPTLLAADRFHPNEHGYATWIPVLNTALDQVLKQK